MNNDRDAGQDPGMSPDRSVQQWPGQHLPRGLRRDQAEDAASTPRQVSLSGEQIASMCDDELAAIPDSEGFHADTRDRAKAELDRRASIRDALQRLRWLADLDPADLDATATDDDIGRSIIPDSWRCWAAGDEAPTTSRWQGRPAHYLARAHREDE